MRGIPGMVQKKDSQMAAVRQIERKPSAVGSKFDGSERDF